MEQKNNSDEIPKRCISTLNNFQFDFDKKSICDCRFIGELFKNGAFPEKVILSCISDLSKENDENNELQMHCLCTILQLVGPILLKTNDLNKPVKKRVSSMNNHGMSSTLKWLIQQVKRMHSKGWKNEEPVEFTGNNYTAFADLPTHMQSVYGLKSDIILAEWIYNECHDIIFNYVKNNKINEVIKLLKISNAWIFNDPVCL